MPKVINDKSVTLILGLLKSISTIIVRRELQEAAQYRSKKRVPAVTYHYQPSGAVIARFGNDFGEST